MRTKSLYKKILHKKLSVLMSLLVASYGRFSHFSTTSKSLKEFFFLTKKGGEQLTPKKKKRFTINNK